MEEQNKAEKQISEARRLVAMAQSKLGQAKSCVQKAKKRTKKPKTTSTAKPKKKKRSRKAKK